MQEQSNLEHKNNQYKTVQTLLDKTKKRQIERMYYFTIVIIYDRLNVEWLKNTLDIINCSKKITVPNTRKKYKKFVQPVILHH